jgi:hypothetical protein
MDSLRSDAKHLVQRGSERGFARLSRIPGAQSITDGARPFTAGYRGSVDASIRNNPVVVLLEVPRPSRLALAHEAILWGCLPPGPLQIDQMRAQHHVAVLASLRLLDADQHKVRDPKGKAILIDGLWTITFGNGGNGGGTDALYFTPGTNNETHGLFGSLNPSK